MSNGYDTEIAIGLVTMLLLGFGEDKDDGDGDGGGGDDDRPRIPVPGRGDASKDEPDKPDDDPPPPDKPKEHTFNPDNLPDVLPGDEDETDQGPPLPEIIDEYPRPETFYQVKWGNTGYGIASKFLRSAAFLAAREYGGLDVAAANAWAAGVAKKAALQTKVWRWINCNGWNDALYATYGWKKKSAVLAPTGRVVRLLKQHAPVLQMLGNGQQPIRNMKWLTPASKGKGGGIGVDAGYRSSHEALWLPGVDLQALWESGGNNLRLTSAEWGNSGVSRTLPPPWVLELGFRWLPGAAPGVSTFGCDGMEVEL